jgi:hypothetical protein
MDRRGIQLMNKCNSVGKPYGKYKPEYLNVDGSITLKLVVKLLTELNSARTRFSGRVLTITVIMLWAQMTNYNLDKEDPIPRI